MGDDSLLNLETARRRLEQLDSERESLSELIRKLKEIRDTMLSLLASAGENQTELKKWLEAVKASHAESISRADALARDFAGAIQSFEKKADLLLNNTSKSVDRTLILINASLNEALDKASQAEKKAYEAIEERFHLLEKHFENFRDEHARILIDISKSYERMRASYDTTRDTVKAIEASVESHTGQTDGKFAQIRKEIEKNQSQVVGEEEILRKAVQELNVHVHSVDQCVSGMQGKFSEETAGLTTTAEALKKAQEGLEKRIRDAASRTNSIQTELNQKHQSLRRSLLILTIFALITFLIVCILLGSQLPNWMIFG